MYSHQLAEAARAATLAADTALQQLAAPEDHHRTQITGAHAALERLDDTQALCALARTSAELAGAIGSHDHARTVEALCDLHAASATVAARATRAPYVPVEPYAQRWEFEGALDELKVHQRGPRVVLRSKTPDGVIQEAYGHLCVHYAIRWLMHAVALKAGHDPDRLSFTRTLRAARRTTASHAGFSPRSTRQRP